MTHMHLTIYPCLCTMEWVQEGADVVGACADPRRGGVGDVETNSRGGATIPMSKASATTSRFELTTSGATQLVCYSEKATTLKGLTSPRTTTMATTEPPTTQPYSYQTAIEQNCDLCTPSDTPQISRHSCPEHTVNYLHLYLHLHNSQRTSIVPRSIVSRSDPH